jgi:aspartyl-tRNA(Asn)/glutamyl-tRNA(Gln) amidotransferase subunit A
MTALPSTLTQLQRKIAGKALSAQEAWQLQLGRRDALNARWHCLSQPLGSEGQADSRGPLAGIALAHKDNLDTWNRRSGCGVDRGESQQGLAPAWAIGALQRAGAGHLGTTVMPELACGATSTNPRFEPCVNPLDPRAVVGGSSSGSAVAVAGGMAYGSLGSDTAGSVRIPAATCGLVGLKTTLGLIPTQGLTPLAPSLDTIGILARTVEDLAQLLGPVAPDLTTAQPGTPPRLRIWIPAGWLHEEVALALETMGREVNAESADLGDDHMHLSALSEIVMQTELARLQQGPLLAGQLGPGVQALALPGLVTPPAWAEAALAVRCAELRRFCQTWLPHGEVLMMPALARPVPDRSAAEPGEPHFEPRELLALHRTMGFINYLGLPAVVLPIARDRRGLPISVQLVGRPFHENTLLAVASQLQERRFGSAGFLPDWHMAHTEN